MRRRWTWLVLGGFALATSLLAWLWLGLPSRTAVAELARRNPGKTRLMLQREAEATARRRPPRTLVTWVPLSQVSRHLIHAVLSAEDQKFFGHEGVDWEAIQKSLGKDVAKRRFARGGSTITQQLAKNLYFGTHKTIPRKLRELVVARWLESDLGKPRILELYLNVIEWGDGVYGCEAAARHWYGKSAATLDAAEAAGLAAMIPNPRVLNPRRSPARHARATRRVLWLMAHAGYLGRDAAGLGSEPPEERVDEAEEPAEPSSAGSAEPALGPSPGEPAPAGPSPAEPFRAEPSREPSPEEPPPAGTSSPLS